MKNKHFSAMAAMLFGATLLSATIANAWTKVGNGGDVVVCTDSDGDQTVELLDVYEAREIYGKKPDLPRTRLNPTELALKLVERLEALAPARRQMFETYIKNFDQEAIFVNYELQDIPDHGFIKVPANCAIRQLVVNACSNASDSFFDKGFDQYNPERGWLLNAKKINSWHEVCPGRYQINKVLWDLLPKDEQALVKTHEAFMRDFRHMGDLDFEFDGPYHPVRYFNEMLFTSGFKTYDYAKFQKLYSAQGRLGNVEELKDGRLILDVKDLGQGVAVTVVPQLKVDIAAMAIGGESSIQLNLTSSEMTFGEMSPTRRLSVSLKTDSEIIRPRRPEYGGSNLRFSGNLVLSMASSGTWKDQLGLEKVLSGEFPRGQFFETGFSLVPECDFDPATGGRTGVVSADISRLSEEETEMERQDGTIDRWLQVEYEPVYSFKVKNTIMDVEVIAKERIMERRPILESTICANKPRQAKFVSFKATGRVFFKGRWRAITNKYVHVDLVNMKVESLF